MFHSFFLFPSKEKQTMEHKSDGDINCNYRFNINVNWWSFIGVWVTASLLVSKCVCMHI